MTEKRVSEISPEFPVDAPTNQPKGYKLSELGFIPEDWSVSTVKDISAIPMQNGLFYEPKRKGKGVPLINVGDMYKSAPVNVESLELFDANTNEIKIFKAAVGDLFFTRSSVVPSGIAFCNIYNSKQENVVFDSHLIRVRPNKELVNPNYLYLNCIAKHARSALIASAKTATMTTIDQGAINRCPVLLPPIKEQTAIANALSDVDALIQELEKLIAKKQAIKTATMQQLLTGRTRLPQFAHHPDGRKKGYKPSELGEIPEDWEVYPLSEYVLSHNAGIYKPKSQYGQGTNIVGVGDIYSISKVDGAEFRKVPLTEGELKQFLLKENDLIYGESSLVREGIARTVYVNKKGEGTAFAWHTRRYRINNEKLDSKYLYYFLASTLGRSHMINNSITTALTGINTVAYFACPLLVFSLEEQVEIASIFSDMDEELEVLSCRLNKTRQIKQGMMQELLTGKTRLVKPAGVA